MSMITVSNRSTLSGGFSKPQQGFSLIEMLISLLMISIGVASVVYLQTRAVNTTVSAYNDTQNTLYLQEMVELLRANRQSAAKGDYNTSLIEFSDLKASGSNIAEKDRYKWFHNMNNALPGVRASISCAANYHCLLELEYDSSINNKKQSLAFIL